MTPETEDKIIHQLITFEELVKHLATKEDMEKALREQLKWIILLHVPTWIGMLGTLVGVIAMILKLGH